MASKFLIYALVDPRSKQWRYIGRSSTGLLRPTRHARACRTEDTHKARWIRDLQAIGLDYEVMVLEEFDTAERLDDAEIEWIARCSEAWIPLTNATIGGRGMPTPNEETRAKLSAMGRRPRVAQPPETRAKISAALRGRKLSPEAIAKMTEARRGMKRPPFSVEWRANMSAAHKGRKLSLETIRRMEGRTPWNKGKSPTPETRLKMSNAARRRRKVQENATH